MYGLYRKMVIFLYNLYILIWIKHGCLANMVYALDPNNGVIKRLWCHSNVNGHLFFIFAGFVCVEVLRPSQPNGVISSVVYLQVVVSDA